MKKTKIIISKEILKIARHASKYAAQLSLLNIWIYKDKIVATDAYVLLEYELGHEQKQIDNMPDNMQIGKGFTNKELKAGISINASELLKKQKFHKHKALKCLEYAVLEKVDDNSVSLTTCDLETTTRNIYRKGEGAFPNYKTIIPKKKDLLCRVGMNAEHLETMMKSFKSSMHNHCYIEIYQTKKNKDKFITEPIVIKNFDNKKKTINFDNRKQGLIMPLKF